MKHIILGILVLAMMVCIVGSSSAQDQSKPDRLVKLFKDHINKSKSLDMKKLLMDVDNPDVVLLAQNYDRMEQSMQSFIDAWKGKSFKLYNTTLKGSKEGVVYMWSSATLDQVKFYVIQMRIEKDWKWFIRDTEVYENVANIGDDGEPIE